VSDDQHDDDQAERLLREALGEVAYDTWRLAVEEGSLAGDANQRLANPQPQANPIAQALGQVVQVCGQLLAEQARQAEAITWLVQRVAELAERDASIELRESVRLLGEAVGKLAESKRRPVFYAKPEGER
jgi:hypothetical protein